MEIEVRKMLPADVPEIARLEQLSFSAPWSERSLRETLASPTYQLYVALSGGNVIGYIGGYITADTLNLANVAVYPLWRRRGVGSRLLEEMLSVAVRSHLYGITLEVRASNEAALALYRRYGFESRGRRKNYYQDPAEDALILWKVFDE